MHKDAQYMPCDSQILHGGMTQIGEVSGDVMDLKHVTKA